MNELEQMARKVERIDMRQKSILSDFRQLQWLMIICAALCFGLVATLVGLGILLVG